MTEDRRNSLINALELSILFLLALSVSLRPLVCGEGARYTFVGLVDAPVANLLVSLPFLFAFFLWLPQMALKGELRLKRTGMEVPILLFVIFVVRSVFISHYEWRSAMTALYWIGQILLFLLLINVLDDRRRVRLIVACVVASAVAAGLYAIHQRFIGFPALLDQYCLDPAGTVRSAGIAPEDMADFRSRMETFRVTGTFLLPTTFAGFLVLVLPLQIGLLADNMRRRKIAIGLGAAILMQLVVLFLTKSKAGWMTFAFGALLMAGIWGRSFVWRFKKPIAVGLGAFVLVAAVAQWRGKLPPASRYVDSLVVRAQYWRAGIDMIRDHPLSGIGLNEYGDCYPAYKQPEDDETQMAHNNFIQLWAETGFFGFASFCAIWIIFLVRCFRLCYREAQGGEGAAPSHAPDAASDMELAAVGAVAGVVAIGLALLGFFSLPVGPVAAVLLLIGWMAMFLLIFPEGSVFGRMAQRGIWVGVICSLIHYLVDFDLYETGVAQTLWMLAAIALAGPSACRTFARPLGSAGRIALAGGAFAATVVVLLLMWPTILFGGVHLANARALVEMDEPNFAKAIAEFRKAATYTPGNAAPHEWLAIIFRNMWDKQQLLYDDESTLQLAIRHFERAAELNPRKARYHFELAELLRAGASNKEMQERAAEEYENAVKYYPVKPLYLARLAFMYEELKRPKQLVDATFRRALDMDARAGRRYNKLTDEMREKIERRVREE